MTNIYVSLVVVIYYFFVTNNLYRKGENNEW